jgi:hypothetical protein
MVKLTRRGLLKQATVGVAVTGVLMGGSQLATVAVVPHEAENLSTTTFAGPLVAHVRDFTTGEVAVLVGTREIIYRDPELVVRLVNAAK